MTINVDLSKLKAFVDNSINMTLKLVRIENITEKVGNAGIQQFLLFHSVWKILLSLVL